MTFSLSNSLIHLNHVPFKLIIKATNNTGEKKIGTVRIFLAPKFNDLKEKFTSFDDQRSFFIELDKFQYDREFNSFERSESMLQIFITFSIIVDVGSNTIVRRSEESNVTIPFEKSYQYQEPGSEENNETFDFCGCGWPSNMLIPRGSLEGLGGQLFVMITDYSGDKVDDEGTGTCNDAFAYCGVRDGRYPDKKPMGYPFDRKSRAIPNNIVPSLDDFVTPNMKVQDVAIRFKRLNTKCPEESVNFPNDGSEIVE